MNNSNFNSPQLAEHRYPDASPRLPDSSVRGGARFRRHLPDPLGSRRTIVDGPSRCHQHDSVRRAVFAQCTKFFVPRMMIIISRDVVVP